jgi:hypothetical protein
LPPQKANEAVKFKNYGLDLVEVVDDGTGISSDDYDTIGIPFLSDIVDRRFETLHF